MSDALKWSDLTNFTPKQNEAIEVMDNHRFVLYGGARGGGKSYLLRWWLITYLVNLYMRFGMRNVRVGLFCETYPDLRDRQISKIRTEFPEWLGKIRDTKTDGLCFFVDEEYGGGMIALRNLDDPSKYKSAEFAAIGVDELTMNPKDVFDTLRGSLRWPGIPRPVFLGTTNPGGIGHGWVKQYWIDRDFPPELKNLSKEFAFVQSFPQDNPHLEETYWEDLRSLGDTLRKAWLHGDWNIFVGQAFPGWRDHLHKIEPFEIPAWWPRWRAIDWGYDKPFCCLWFARNPGNGRIYVYREVYESGVDTRSQARIIKEMTPETNVLITYADPSMWQQQNKDGIIFTAESQYAKEGVYLTKGDNNRLSGKQKVDTLLTSLPDGDPGIQVFSTCKNLIRTLPTLAYDKVRVEDVDTKQEDHAYDALRYGLTNYIVVQANTPDDFQEELPNAHLLEKVL
jgi:hypothetical protein